MAAALPSASRSLAVASICGFSTACSLAASRGPEFAPDAYLPAGVRLLTNVELQRAAEQLLGVPVDAAAQMPPEVRQSGYTRNADAAMSGVALVAWQRITNEAIERAVAERGEALWPCKTATPSCVRQHSEVLLSQAFRRRPTATETASVAALASAEPAHDSPAAAARGVLETLLQSPSFFYATELGAQDAGPLVELSAEEIATSLAFTFSGSPPDEQLRQAAEEGKLSLPSEREHQARRLLSQSSSRYAFRRFVLEWLEADRLLEVAKDAEQFPRFESVKPALLEETERFTDDVLMRGGPTLRDLLTAEFAPLTPKLARYYGVNAFGPRVSLAGSARLGVLQQGSVLAAHSHPDTTSPVKRGDFILRRILCKTLPRPAELGIEVVMPKPDGAHTARELIGAHGANPMCAACHEQIDPLGFAFENFDTAGQVREQDAGKPIDTRAQFPFAGKRATFEDSRQLSRWLAERDEAASCFSKQALRYFAGQTSEQTEAAFASVIARLPAERRDNLLEQLVAYAGSDLFTTRRSTAP